MKRIGGEMGIQQLEGGCFCRAIRYRLSGEPHGSMICHCRICRRLLAAPVGAWLSVPVGHFCFLQGAPKTFSTSAPVMRWFCGTCGTHVAYASTDEPDYVEVATCSLDEPSLAPPTHHSWLSHDLPWIVFGDGLRSFPRSRHGDVA
jgi:hypothetical protein